MEALLVLPVMLLEAMQMYFQLMPLVKGGVTNLDILETREPLKYQLYWLGGLDAAWQLSVALPPIITSWGPMIVGVSGPSEHKHFQSCLVDDHCCVLMVTHWMHLCSFQLLLLLLVTRECYCDSIGQKRLEENNDTYWIFEKMLFCNGIWH